MQTPCVLARVCALIRRVLLRGSLLAARVCIQPVSACLPRRQEAARLYSGGNHLEGGGGDAPEARGGRGIPHLPEHLTHFNEGDGPRQTEGGGSAAVDGLDPREARRDQGLGEEQADRRGNHQPSVRGVGNYEAHGRNRLRPGARAGLVRAVQEQQARRQEGPEQWEALPRLDETYGFDRLRRLWRTAVKGEQGLGFVQGPGELEHRGHADASRAGEALSDAASSVVRQA